MPRQPFQAAIIIAMLPHVGGCTRDDGAPPIDLATTGGPSATASGTDTSPLEYCIPGETRCNGQQSIETCSPTGLEWLSEACPANAFCESCDGPDATCAQAYCVSPCDIDPLQPSSVGCSFIANRQLHPLEDYDDGIVIGNPHADMTATVSIFKIPEGKRKEELVEGFPIQLPPGEAFVHRINTSFIQGRDSMFRTGGMFRITSDIPILGYQHSPLHNNQFNDSLLLLPESVVGSDYVVTSYPPIPSAAVSGGNPSYFEVIALHDLTTIEWTPPVATHGNGLPIPPVAAGATGTMKMNRFDTMRVAASNQDTTKPIVERDISGTVIHADKPIWVVGATRCTAAPIPENFNQASCDNVQELLFPLQHWGRRYVAPAAPPRSGISTWTHWRIYAGSDNVTISATPEYDGSPWTSAALPHTFASRGEYIDISVPPETHIYLQGDGPFMPVLHLQAKRVLLHDEDPVYPGDVPGDTSMAQMVPTEQFLNKYVFMTGIGYRDNWATIIRQAGKSAVTVDGTIVDNFTAIGNYEVAHVPITNRLEDDTDVHVAESDDPFGLIQVGYSRDECADQDGADGCINPGSFQSACTFPHGRCNSSYAHPGGMKAEVIYVP